MPVVQEVVHPRGLDFANQRKVAIRRDVHKESFTTIAKRVVNHAPYIEIESGASLRMIRKCRPQARAVWNTYLIWVQGGRKCGRGIHQNPPHPLRLLHGETFSQCDSISPFVVFKCALLVLYKGVVVSGKSHCLQN